MNYLNKIALELSFDEGLSRLIDTWHFQNVFLIGCSKELSEDYSKKIKSCKNLNTIKL